MTEEEDLVSVGDDTPKLEEQARLHGWKAGLFNFGKAEQPGIVDHFNPGLVRRPDGLWLLVRRSELVPGMPYGRNGIWTCRLEEDLTPVGGHMLKFPDSGPEEQFEDPRAVYWNGQTWVGAVNFTWFADGSWTGAHQCLGVFRDDPEWTAIARRDPPVGTNKGQAGHTDGKHNKNLTWFFHEGKLHLLYTSEPWLVMEFGAHWEEQKHHVGEGVKWEKGQIRGGTPPVLVDDLFWTFFHSSLPWRGRFRRYFAGAMAFEARAPFKPVLVTREPLLIGSQNDPWQQRKPLVVFPCGALLENGRWLITYGVNDLKAGWIEIPHEDVVKLAQPKPTAPAALLLSEATPKPVFEALPFDHLDGNKNLSGGVESGHAIKAGETCQATRTVRPSSPLLASPTAHSGSDAPPAQTLTEKRRSAAAKARIVLAEKRALGLVVRRGKSRKKRRRNKQLKL